MTHAAKGQYDTNRLEFHRIKMYHWQGHALGVLSSSVEAVWGLSVEDGPRLYTCSQRSNGEWVAGAELGLAALLVIALQAEVSLGAQVRGHRWAEHQHVKRVIEDWACLTIKKLWGGTSCFEQNHKGGKLFFPPTVSGRTTCLNWRAKYTWGLKTHMRTHTTLTITYSHTRVPCAPVPMCP